MAEGTVYQQNDQLCKEIKDKFHEQLKTNTQYLSQLKERHIMRYGAAVPVKATLSKISKMPKMVEDIVKELHQTNKEISDLMGKLPVEETASVELRDSAYSGSSGIPSWQGSPDEGLIEAVQEEANGDAGYVPMRPESVCFVERQGAASQTPRRDRGTRQAVEDPDVAEEKPST
ncbi:uncharacterized protein LOC124151232 [Haliotis rufescens]|uniref:uncharacterized protein LOC124151232 n=1 Tax=Haliotis rufescens TaxID=6454 RepID=UPI00201F99BA|nr:uncharacterized protein LOC124151232 [Haliotis rufescens]XP_048248597.1 uncharacterized protein LOC124151232 [Haliotis rufescens]XP_048248598.1 uncharacterized protein LOC124151232 [Haliotis rufescens]